jgi:uncharacterized protein (DUF433 family)
MALEAMVPTVDSPLVGLGLYTIPEAARYIREPRQKLDRWARGYTFAHRSERRWMAPILQHDVSTLMELRVLTFLDMVELKVVALFRKLGVSLARIREASELATRDWGMHHPFATRQVLTDGTRLFHRWGLEGGGTLAEVGTERLAFEEMAQPFLVELDFEHGQLAERYWPSGRDAGIVLDPLRSFGKPIDEKSGVPTRVLAEMVRGSESPDAVARWYEVEVTAVLRAREFEDRLASEGEQPR